MTDWKENEVIAILNTYRDQLSKIRAAYASFDQEFNKMDNWCDADECHKSTLDAINALEEVINDYKADNLASSRGY